MQDVRTKSHRDGVCEVEQCKRVSSVDDVAYGAWEILGACRQSLRQPPCHYGRTPFPVDTGESGNLVHPTGGRYEANRSSAADRACYAERECAAECRVMGQDYGVVECSERENFQFPEKPLRRGIGIPDAGESEAGDGTWGGQFATDSSMQLL